MSIVTALFAHIPFMAAIINDTAKCNCVVSETVEVSNVLVLAIS